MECTYKCPFRYWGSKARLCPKIMELTQQLLGGRKFIVSPFCGSAVVELNLAKNFPQCTVTCYDSNPHLINFHNQAQLHPKVLRTKILQMLKRPATKAMHEKLFQRMKGESLQDAADWWWCSRFSYNGKVRSFLQQPIPTDVKIQEYPKNIKFVCKNSMEVLSKLPDNRWKNIYMYLDPPYVQDSARAYVWANKASDGAAFEHKTLAALLSKAKTLGAAWVLSYGKDPAVSRMYRKFKKIPVDISTSSWIKDQGVQKSMVQKEFLVTSEYTPATAAKIQ